MPRTTLDIDATVLRELKRRREEGKTLGQVASELLAKALVETEDEPPPFEWKTASMGTPRFDIDDKDMLWSVLDGGAPRPLRHDPDD